MSEVETVKIENPHSETGYTIINKSDLKKDQKLYEDKAEKGKHSKSDKSSETK